MAQLPMAQNIVRELIERRHGREAPKAARSEWPGARGGDPGLVTGSFVSAAHAMHMRDINALHHHVNLSKR